jgi:hypothetical protein
MTAEDRMERAARWIMIGSVVFVALMFAVVAAFAHDHNRPGLDDWYGGLQSQYGTCCGGPAIDATTLDGTDWDTKDGHYRVRLEGEWVIVPDGAVLNQPNKDGRTLIWATKGYGGIWTVRCFMPGMQM